MIEDHFGNKNMKKVSLPLSVQFDDQVRVTSIVFRILLCNFNIFLVFSINCIVNPLINDPINNLSRLTTISTLSSSNIINNSIPNFDVNNILSTKFHTLSMTRSIIHLNSLCFFSFYFLAYLRPVSCLSRPTAVGSPRLSSIFSGLRLELYEAETRLTYGSETEPHIPAIMVRLKSINTNKILFTQ